MISIKHSLAALLCTNFTIKHINENYSHVGINLLSFEIVSHCIRRTRNILLLLFGVEIPTSEKYLIMQHARKKEITRKSHYIFSGFIDVMCSLSANFSVF